MKNLRSGVSKTFLIGAVLALGGCAGIGKMAANFEERWENPRGDLEAEQPTISEEQKMALVARVDQYMGSPAECSDMTGPAGQVLTVDPNNVNALIILGECAMKGRDLASARQRFTAVNEIQPNARALRGLGAVALVEERPEEAKTALFKSAQLYSGDWKTWNNLGYAEDLLQNWEGAANAYSRASSLNATSAAPLNNLGMSLMRQNKLDESISAFEKALYRDPSLEIAELNMRIAHAMKGDYANALAGATDNERAIILNNVGVAAMSRGEYKTAVKMFREALDANPVFYSVAYNNLERAQLMQQQ